eukprot:6488735-Amphidinium_carterae.3
MKPPTLHELHTLAALVEQNCTSTYRMRCGEMGCILQSTEVVLVSTTREAKALGVLLLQCC